MSGAIRNFIRLKPLNPKYPHLADTVDIEHIVSFRARSWELENPQITEIMLSNGEILISKESPKEFEERLKKAANNINIQE